MDAKRRDIIRELQQTICDGRPVLNPMIGVERTMQICYTKQAAEDLLDEIMSKPREPVQSIVEAYWNRMDEYSCVDNGFGIIYSIKHDYATYILDCLLF